MEKETLEIAREAILEMANKTDNFNIDNGTVTTISHTAMECIESIKTNDGCPLTCELPFDFEPSNDITVKIADYNSCDYGEVDTEQVKQDCFDAIVIIDNLIKEK